MALPVQPTFKHAEGGIRIVFNEVQRTVAGNEDFTGEIPDVTPEDPKYGSIVYHDCTKSGIFTFQAGVLPWGANRLDWIKVWRVIPYIDLVNVTDFRVTIIPPETAQSGLPFPEAVWVTSLTDYTDALMEKLLHLSNPLLTLRPGCQLKITTTGATVPQMVEVWWERARQIRPNERGSEYFAYGV